MSSTRVQIGNMAIAATYRSNFTSLGSCFADSIGRRLQRDKFNILPNPYGVIFNPISIFDLINITLGQKEIHPDLYLEHDERYLHHQFHSQLNADSQQALAAQLNKRIEQTKSQLNKSNILILTFGTAFIHRHKATDTIVANCHKVSASEFQKELLTQKQILLAFEEVYSLLPKDIHIILTVSPVRHIREGLPENMESKAILRSTCGSFTRQYKNVNYFPAFEIMLDELRDYRYYKSDLIHPTTEAEDMIYHRFLDSLLDQKAKPILEKVQQINRALAHTPFNEHSSAHKKFLQETIQKMKGLLDQVDFSSEIEELESRL